MEKFDFKVNGKEYSSNEGTISGGQILEIAGFLPVDDFNLFKKIEHGDFEPVQEQEIVNLKAKGIEMLSPLRKVGGT